MTTFRDRKEDQNGIHSWQTFHLLLSTTSYCKTEILTFPTKKIENRKKVCWFIFHKLTSFGWSLSDGNFFLVLIVWLSPVLFFSSLFFHEDFLESAGPLEGARNWKATCAAFQLSTSLLSDRTTLKEKSRALWKQKKMRQPVKSERELVVVGYYFVNIGLHIWSCSQDRCCLCFGLNVVGGPTRKKILAHFLFVFAFYSFHFSVFVCRHMQ